MIADPRTKLTDHQQLLIETKYGNRKKSVLVAYLLLFFTAVGHQFYLGRPGRAIIQFALIFVVIGLFWILFDIFMLAGEVRESNEALYNDLTLAAMHG